MLGRITVLENRFMKLQAGLIGSVLLVCVLESQNLAVRAMHFSNKMAVAINK